MAPARLTFIALSICGLGLACATSAPPCEPSEPEVGRFARVEVAIDREASLRADRGTRVAALVRQSARDWLEQRNRLASDGDLTLLVTIDDGRLRTAAVAWWFAWIAAPDHLDAQVSVLRGLDRVPRCPVRVESALAGYSWRDPDARLDRLARRLGHRIADAL
jgi:hypothetical protein